MQGGTFFILHPLMSSLSLVWIVCREVGLLQAFYLREGTVDLAGTTIHLHAKVHFLLSKHFATIPIETCTVLQLGYYVIQFTPAVYRLDVISPDL